MLYASTRSKVETYTAQRTLWEQRASDGGFFVPMKLPVFKRTEIIRLRNRTPEDNIALVLNKFFQSELAGKDVQFLIGRDYYRFVNISHKMILGQLWHNPEGELNHIVRLLTRRIAVEAREDVPGEWPDLAVRIALLFAMFGELSENGTVNTLYPIDVAVPTGDYRWPMAAWYARKMGLPIGTIICCCNGNDGIRELLHRGQIRLDGAVQETVTPLVESPVPWGVERAIHTVLGSEETDEFLRVLKKGSTYVLNPEQKRLLGEGMYVTVSSNKRLMQVIPNVYRTFGQILCPYSALVYTGVMDYQSVTGKYNKVLMLSDYSPAHSLAPIAAAMGTDPDDIARRLNLT